MIVSCPRCHKQYRLDISRVNYSNLPDNSGLGVQLACSNCNEQWWEPKKESVNTNQQELRAAVPDQPFRNLTDISSLYQRQSGNYAYQYSYSAPDTSFGDNFSARSEEQMFPANKRSSKVVNTKQPKFKSLIRVAIWSVVLIGVTMLIAFSSMKFGDSGNLLSTTSAQPTNSGEFEIDGLHFYTKSIDDTVQQVLVIGYVKNTGQIAIPLHNIQITAYGTCNNGQTPNEQGLCEVRTWHYKWKQELIQPGEKLTFKSAAKVPANLSIEQVHADVATN